MLRKYPHRGRSFLFYTKVVIGIELALFGGTFVVWHNLNTSRDFRRKVKGYAPVILESYYKIGEVWGEDRIRAEDELVWSADK